VNKLLLFISITVGPLFALPVAEALQAPRTVSTPDVRSGKTQISQSKLLLRRLRKGDLGAGGVVMMARLDEASVAADSKLKGDLELISENGIGVETEYVFDLDAPFHKRSPVKWRIKPADFDFVLTWTSTFQEFFADPVGHIRVKVDETFVIYKVSRPGVTRKWQCSYKLDRDIRKDEPKELLRLNETVVAPARTQILKEIRTFIAAKTTKPQ
jgi:hypothetical protein